LKELGADDVIPEEFETSIEVFAKVLNYFLIPKQQIEQYIQQIRKEVYSGTRTTEINSNLQAIKNDLPNLQFASLKVEADSKLLGTKLGDGMLRNEYKVNVVAVHRGSDDITELNPQTEFFENDIVYLFGTQDAIIHVQEVFLKKK
jgi:CPA2 family monovalent cation:H+ antiporter-2